MVKVNHFQLYGLRKEKYQWLAQNDLATTEWKELKPEAPFHLFVPQDTALLSEYGQGWKIAEIMPVNSVGVVTGQDEETIAFTKEAANQLARAHGIAGDKVKKILYRPFDERFIIYDRKVVTRTRPEVMRHMMAGENLGLISARSNKSGEMNHFFCTRYIMETKCGESTTQSCVFPLYLHPDPAKPLGEKRDWPLGKEGRWPNLDKKFVDEFSKRLGMEFDSTLSADKSVCGPKDGKYGPEDVFNYIYAIFHSPEYRRRYAEFLKIDFPRVPMTANKKLFQKLCELGGELVTWHLFENEPSGRSIARRAVSYPVSGESRVEKGFPKYDDAKARVFINKDQYFDGVPQEVWNFYIGGYQVAVKWLKDRRGRSLSHDDLAHYQKIVVALSETIRLMAEIDKTINAFGAWPEAFSRK